MAENRRGRERDFYYFTRGQLAILAAGFSIASLIIFLLGVLIGQGIEARKLIKKEGPLVKIPARPPEAAGPGAGASAREEITFYDTLAKAPGAAQPARAESPKKVLPAGKAAKPADRETKPVGEVKTAAQEKAREKPVADVKGPLWTVQVNAFPDEKAAQNLVKRLKDKGYDAYLVTADIRGKTWYRVRVGRFGTRAEAKELQELLMTKENFPKAIAVRR